MRLPLLGLLDRLAWLDGAIASKYPNYSVDANLLAVSTTQRINLPLEDNSKPVAHPPHKGLNHDNVPLVLCLNAYKLNHILYIIALKLPILCVPLPSILTRFFHVPNDRRPHLPSDYRPVRSPVESARHNLSENGWSDW